MTNFRAALPCPTKGPERQHSIKYRTRDSPPFSANALEHQGTVKLGNNGQYWRSTSNSAGIYTWHPVTRTSTRRSRSRPRAGSLSRALCRLKLSRNRSQSRSRSKQRSRGGSRRRSRSRGRFSRSRHHHSRGRARRR